jgi:hypothetical protein
MFAVSLIFRMVTQTTCGLHMHARIHVGVCMQSRIATHVCGSQSRGSKIGLDVNVARKNQEQKEVLENEQYDFEFIRNCFIEIHALKIQESCKEH